MATRFPLPMNECGRRYQREVEPRGEDSLSRIARRIPASASVLDLGSGSGALGRYLTAAKGCAVDGIDLDPAAEEARAGYRRFLVADLETADLAALFGSERYAFAVCADVIEHLRRPERLLAQLPGLLAPGGRVLLSVPNIAYAGVIADLLAGEFTYVREGLLDDTHVRFFTRRSLFRLLRQVGLVPLDLERVMVDVNRSEFRGRYLDAMTPPLRGALLARPEALTYQFVVETSPAAPGLTALDDEAPGEEVVPELEFSSRVYWRDETGAYEESASATAIGRVGHPHQSLTFEIPASAAALSALRLDPADRPGYVRLHGIRLHDATQACIWEWDGSLEALARGARSQVEFAEAAPPERGVIAVLTGSDPSVELPVPADALRKLGSAGSLVCELSWPQSSDYLVLAARLDDTETSRRRVAELSRNLADAEAKLAARTAQVRSAEDRLDEVTSALVHEWTAVRARLVDLSRRFVWSRAWRVGDWIGELSLRVRRRPPAELARLLEEATASLLAPSRADPENLGAWLGEQRGVLERYQDQIVQLIDSKRYRLGRRLLRMAALLRLRFSPATPADEIAHILALAFKQLESARAATGLAAGRPGAGASGAVERILAPALEPHARSADAVVCVHNAPEETRNCLRSLLECSTPPYRVILVDDGSAEETSAILRSFAREQGATLLRNDTARGYTYAANQGLRASSADYVVLLNSDTVVTPGWLDRIIACGESDPAIGAIGPLSNCASWQSIPRPLAPDGDWAQNPLPEGMSVADMGAWVARHSPRAYPRLPFLNGFCFAIKRTAIDAIGVFDEEHFGQGFHEENDYSLRLGKAGFTLAVADDAYVYHHQSRSYSNDRRKTLSESSGQMLGRLHTQALIERSLERLHSDLPLAGVRARAAVALDSWPARSAARRRFASRRIAFVLPQSLVSSAASAIVQQADAARYELGIDARIVGVRSQEREFERVHASSTPTEWAEDSEVVAAGLDRFEAVVLAGASVLQSPGRVPRSVPVVWQLGFGELRPVDRVSERAVICTAATERSRAAVARSLGTAPPLVRPGIDTRLFAPRPRGDRGATDGVVRVAAAIRDAQDAREVQSTLRLLVQAQEAHRDRFEILLLGCARTRAELAPHLDRTGWAVPGRLGRAELAALLGDVDVFLDLAAGGPGSFALEAAASGAVSVVARGSGAAEVARDAPIRVVDPEDHAAAAGALSHLVAAADERRRIARQGVEGAARHTAGAGLERLLELLFPEPS
jgi:GT2 family glycosyltransferase/2-polyprenyl-3-methyl-5-hydroxy-6-metoxy-1,4-benzoquinol methylase